MMVPRSYKYATSPTETGTQRRKESAERSFSAKPKKKEHLPTSRQSSFLPAQSVPAKPVIIPTRTKDISKQGQRRGSDKKTRARNRDSEKSDFEQSPRSIAVSSVRSTCLNKESESLTWSKNAPFERRTGNESSGGTLSSSSPQTWDFLLSPPKETDFESSSFESDATLGPFSHGRSISMESMPSLAEDDSSISSENPSTPGVVSTGRRNRSLSTSIGEDCVLAHPLLQVKAAIPEVDEEENRPSPSASFKTSFKSNLTASFRAIRSAARSISDLAPPLTQRDDFLSRSILSIDAPFKDERRPLPSQTPPDPALRRYLNPIKLSAAELHYHTEQAPLSCKAAIQMQPYQLGARQSANASSPPIFGSSGKAKIAQVLSKNALDTEDPLTSSLLPKQREPRENSDFLRVIVLEMNMRKVGKFSDSSPGRARLWLPAKQAGQSVGEDKKETVNEARKFTKGGAIPNRWISEQP